MAKQLKDIEIDEISLVDRPANPGARVRLFKREDPLNSGKALIEKCLDAFESNDYREVTKEDFEGALDHLAQACARQDNVDFYTGYARIVASGEGQQLLEGLRRLEIHTSTHAPVHKAGESPAWLEISKQAELLRERSTKPLTQAQAVQRVCEEHPELYSRYLREEGFSKL